MLDTTSCVMQHGLKCGAHAQRGGNGSCKYHSVWDAPIGETFLYERELGISNFWVVWCYNLVSAPQPRVLPSQSPSSPEPSISY